MCVFMTGFSPTSSPDPSPTRDVKGLGNGSILNFSHRVVNRPVMTLREKIPFSLRLPQGRGDWKRRWLLCQSYARMPQNYCEKRYFHIKFNDAVYFQLPNLPNLARTIDSFDESSCDQQFRFLKHQGCVMKKGDNWLSPWIRLNQSIDLNFTLQYAATAWHAVLYSNSRLTLLQVYSTSLRHFASPLEVQWVYCAEVATLSKISPSSSRFAMTWRSVSLVSVSSVKICTVG